MNNINIVILSGNLTHDPDLRKTGRGTSVVNLSVANNQTWHDKKTGEKRQNTAFIGVAVFGRQADLCIEYLSKGDAVLAEGLLQQDRWQDQQTGRNRSKITIKAHRVQFLGAPKAQKEQMDTERQGDRREDANDDDVPF